MYENNKLKEMLRKELLEQLNILNIKFKLNITECSRMAPSTKVLRINVTFYMYGEEKTVSRYILDDEFKYMKYSYKNDRVFEIAKELIKEIVNYILEIKKNEIAIKNTWREV